MNKIERLQHITTFLRARRRTTLAELLAETGASRATLMRDLAWLPSFTPTRGQLFDMFPHTSHYELLLQLERRQP